MQQRFVYIVIFCRFFHIVRLFSDNKENPSTLFVFKASDVLMPDLYTLPLNSTPLGELVELLKLLKFAHASPMKSIKKQQRAWAAKRSTSRTGLTRFYETCRIYSDIWFWINSMLNAICQSSNYSISQSLKCYANFGYVGLID